MLTILLAVASILATILGGIIGVIFNKEYDQIKKFALDYYKFWKQYIRISIPITILAILAIYTKSFDRYIDIQYIKVVVPILVVVIDFIICRRLANLITDKIAYEEGFNQIVKEVKEFKEQHLKNKTIQQ